MNKAYLLFLALVSSLCAFGEHSDSARAYGTRPEIYAVADPTDSISKELNFGKCYCGAHNGSCMVFRFGAKYAMKSLKVDYCGIEDCKRHFAKELHSECGDSWGMYTMGIKRPERPINFKLDSKLSDLRFRRDVVVNFHTTIPLRCDAESVSTSFAFQDGELKEINYDVVSKRPLDRSRPWCWLYANHRLQERRSTDCTMRPGTREVPLAKASPSRSPKEVASVDFHSQRFLSVSKKNALDSDPNNRTFKSIYCYSGPGGTDPTHRDLVQAFGGRISLDVKAKN